MKVVNPVLFSSLSTDFNGQGEREWVLVLVFGWQGMEVVRDGGCQEDGREVHGMSGGV